ncbi:hypothetical protein [Ornithinimicrobium panacihumi]|uniref:hypothetical protein n=1 Tax=Ornithinimicrobium panacihumi TaxID=2008449 RepID=UPI003F8BA499
MSRATASLEASLLVWVQELLLRTASELLGSRDVQDHLSMSKSARQTWRAQVKASVAGELQVALGVGVVEARQMVAVAASPGAIRTHVLEAMRRGEAVWRLVRVFQRRTRRLTTDQAARVAEAMFGTNAARAAVERLDADGELELGRPWHHAEYYDALDREIAHVKDEDEEHEERAAALEARDTRLEINDDGTAVFSCTTSLATGIAIHERIDGAARRARHGGDPRTLAQLRTDIAAALLIYGTITALGAPESPGGEQAGRDVAPGDGPVPDQVQQDLALMDEVVTPDDIEMLRAIITATPAGHVDLVVPWDALLGAVCAHCNAPALGPAAGPPASREGEGVECACSQDAGAECAQTQQHDGLDCACGQDRASEQVSTGVGELVGLHTGFVTARTARQIVLAPGTELSRILASAADGRCIERSTASYSPDTDMKRQIRAADVYGRGPGCRRPARDCEIDHEKEWLTSGWTAEPNLNCKAQLDHFRKTKKLWRSVMNSRRDVTWTTLLGQVATTRGHDYRQYFARVDALAPYDPTDVHHDGVWVGDRADLQARRDLVNQLLYAAIVHRDPGERAEAFDDVVDAEDWLGLGDWVQVNHTDEDGRRRPGPPPAHPTPEEILGLAQPDDDPAPSEDSSSGTSGEWGRAIQERDEEDPPPF